MQRISSNATLPLKIFLPTFWIVFFGLFTVAICLTDRVTFGGFSTTYLKAGFVLFFLAGTALLGFTVMQLKRVELDNEYLYASNYFKTYRYPFNNVEKLTERDLGLMHMIQVQLKTAGHFGYKFPFLLDETMLKNALEKFPEAAKQLQFKTKSLV
jgi:hypothetical protein